jgi:N-acetylglucosaminyldiphosphoundecaprenol N-acetyl-beta-D-mannosaminyltransferase
MSNRYLIVQLADIGDLILSTPALAALREAQPDAHIALLTNHHAAPIMNGTGLVDEVITFERRTLDNTQSLFIPANLKRIFDLRKGHYDAVIFFHHFTLKLGTIKFALIALVTGAKRRIGIDNRNGWFLTERLPDEGFGAKHQAQYWLDLVGLVGADSAPRRAVVGKEVSSFQFPVSSLNEGDKFEADKRTKRKTIVIHAGSGGYNLARRWDTEKFAALADRLHEKYGAQIMLVGGTGDDSAAVKATMKSVPIDLTGQTNLNQLAGVIEQADLFIGAESGVMHLAAAVGTPVVTIFGPGNPDAWGPWNPGGKIFTVRSAPECSPCSYVGQSIGLRNGCPARTCIRMVTVDIVTMTVERAFNAEKVEEVLKLTPTKQVFRNRIHILGLPVDGITYEEWLELIGQWIQPHPSPSPQVERSFAHHICTINPEFMMIARKDSNFRNILNRADLCIPDGVGLLWAARRIGKPLPERVTGSDGVPRIAERAAQMAWRLFFLGAAPGVAEKAANMLRTTYPGVQIVGTYSGSPAPNEEDKIVEMVNKSYADILFVAYGAPEQDKWIARNLPRLNTKVAMGVGGAFDFIAGVVPRAPIWMQQMGLEWLYRLYLQPWRIRRMMRLPQFVIAVLREKQSALSRQDSAKD